MGGRKLARGVGVASHHPPISRADTRGTPTVVVQPMNEGFDWASAAIGAGAAGGLVLLIGIGGSTHRQRRRHVDAARQA